MLHPLKAVFWEEEQTLLLADLHLGKASHFRKAGIGVPGQVEQDNLLRLHLLLKEFEPQKVLFLGDLFHSDHNRNWEEFGQFIESHPEVSFELVPGNHDILSDHHYQRYGLVLHPEHYEVGPFCFCHDPEDAGDSGLYHLSGHLHPGVRMLGKGRQGLRLPCFYFGVEQGILPAFGRFTGYATVRPKKSDKVFVIVEEQVWDVS